MLEGVSQVSIPSVPSSMAAQRCRKRDERSQPSYDEVTDEMEVLRSAMDSTESNLIVFDGTVGGQIVHTLANTGASRRYIKRSVIEHAGLRLVDTSKTQAVRLLNGVMMQVYGDVLCTFKLGNFEDTALYTVLDLNCYDVILEMDFWTKYKARPDYDTSSLQIEDNSVPRTLYRAAPSLANLMEADILVVSYKKAMKVLRKGAIGILYKIDSPEVTGLQRRKSLARQPALHLQNLETKWHEDSLTGSTSFDAELGLLKKVFLIDLPKEVGPRRYMDHRIDTRDAWPVNRNAYSLTPEQLKEQACQICYLKEQDLIRPSSSPWGAPVLFVKKKDGTWHMCVDYWALNEITVKNGYPLPKIQECLDQIGSAHFFSKIDLLSGYWQICIADGDTSKMVFNTRIGKYEFRVLPFGLTNALATFQTLMNNILQPFLNDFVVVYLDDILVYSKMEEEHCAHIKKVLQVLLDNSLYTRPDKCTFFQTTIEFCGHIVMEGKVRMDPRKLAAIQDWPRPTTIHHARQFLGLTSYYWWFIKDFADIAAPLHELTRCTDRERSRKHRTVSWTPICQHSFNNLKACMTDALVLQQPNTTQPFIIKMDTSDHACSAVLLQTEGGSTVEHPIAYESQKFNPAEAHYTTHKRELLAIKHGLRAWHCYIDNGHVTKVCTDHAGLQYMKTTRKPSKQLAQWIEKFEEYSLEILYKPGQEMVVADSLSRRADLANVEDLGFMEWVEYMTDFLNDGRLSEDEDVDELLRTRSDEFCTDEDGLWHRDSDDHDWIPCTPLWARIDLVEYLHHQYGHMSEQSLYGLIQDCGWWPQMWCEV